MEKKTKGITRWLYWFMLAVAVIIVYKTIDNVSSIAGFFQNLLGILTPFLCGILISYILYLPCRKVENLILKAKSKFIKKKSRTISVILVYIIALLIIITIINFILPPVIQSIIDLVNNLPNYYNMLTKHINELPEDSFFKSEQVVNAVASLQKININEIINIEKISQYAKGAISFASSIFDIFVAIIVSVYILIERADILRFLKKLVGAIFEPKMYRNIGKYFNRTNSIFFNFLLSQCLDAIVVGILVSIAMSIMGVKYGVLLGFMIGLFNLIPYFGAIIAVIIAGIITLLTGGFNQALIMVIIVTILQQIDANIINPKIVGGSLKMSPILVIVSVTIGGAYFNVIGMFLAVPIAAVLKLLITDFIDWKNKLKEENKIKEEIEVKSENK